MMRRLWRFLRWLVGRADDGERLRRAAVQREIDARRYSDDWRDRER